MLDSTLKEALTTNVALSRAVSSTPSFIPDFVETRGMLKACVGAHVALARIGFSEQSIASFEHCLPTLQMMDAVGAEQLAGNPVSIVEALTASPGSQRATLARYANALSMARELLQHNSVNRTLLSRVVHNISNGKAKLVAGDQRENTSQGLDQWQLFVQQGAGDLDVLVMMAIAHYQLVTVKAYTQANTQLVHAFDALLFVEESVLRHACLPLASYFSKYASAYQAAIDGVRRENQWEPWVLFYLKAVTTVAHDVANRLTDVQNHAQELLEKIDDVLPKQADTPAFCAVCIQPSCGIADVVSAGIAGRQTAASYLNKLADEGLLTRQRLGKEKRFVNPFVLSLFTTVSFSS